MATLREGNRLGQARVVVATTVALSFISFWRGAAIVLSDMASSAFYAGGIAEQAIGKSAPWFILAVMLFSFAVRSVYMESCSMFVRGGVYVVVRDAMGPFAARLSVSALIFDYILTGPISSVSAGQYLGRLLNETAGMLHTGMHMPPDLFAMGFAVLVTAYFWWNNVKGIHESSGKALRIMQITTAMVVLFLIWCPLTILLRGAAQIPPAPLPGNLHFSDEGLGWFKGTVWPTIPVAAIIIAFGHSLLSMSGFETLAQVYREIAYPKLKNLKLTGNIVCVYAVICTGLVTLFAGLIIPDAARRNYTQNLLGGLAMHLAGPQFLRLLFHVFVVIVGVLILAGAVNTSMIGANGVLNRVAEDGVLVDWFRKPHPRFGTTYRLVNTITVLQLATVLASRGNVYLLGEAYAFGVVWSFFLKSLGVLVLRFRRHDQHYKHPGNIRIAGREIPLGLISTTSVLFLVAIANLVSKRIATIYGVVFTLVLFLVFTLSERINLRKLKRKKGALEQFNLDHKSEITAGTLHARPGCVLVAVRDYVQMAHLESVLRKTNLRRHDIVVMTVRPITAGAGEYDLQASQLFADYEKELFTRVVAMAEREGKTVDLLVIPGVDPFDALVQTAAKLQASRLVTGVSPRMDSDELARRIGLAWEALPQPRHPFSRNHQRRPPKFLRKPGPSPAAFVAGRSRSPARDVAQAEPGARLQPPSPGCGRPCLAPSRTRTAEPKERTGYSGIDERSARRGSGPHCGSQWHSIRRLKMTKIDAVIQPFKLEEVKNALKEIGIDGMTISEVRGHGRQKGHKEAYRGQEYQVDLLPKVKIELVVPTSRSEEVIQALTRAAQTGKIGDGKIFVYEIAQTIRIRNGDRGDAAL